MILSPFFIYSFRLFASYFLLFMTQKNKKIPPEKKIKQKMQGLPANANVKVIEIKPRKIFTYLLLFLVFGWLIYNTWMGRNMNGVTTEYNDNTDVNQIVALFKSGSYAEMRSK